MDLISRENQFYRKAELFGRPFCISILKALWTQILCHSLHFNAFCMVQGYFPQNLQKLKREDRISRGIQFCRKSELFGQLYFTSILKDLWTQFFPH